MGLNNQSRKVLEELMTGPKDKNYLRDILGGMELAPIIHRIRKEGYEVSVKVRKKGRSVYTLKQANLNIPHKSKPERFPMLMERLNDIEEKVDAVSTDLTNKLSKLEGLINQLRLDVIADKHVEDYRVDNRAQVKLFSADAGVQAGG